MTPRRRNPENRQLPPGWRFKHGAYFYRVPESVRDQWAGKTEFRLGATIQEAYRAYASRIEAPGEIRTVGQLLDRYAAEIIPEKAIKTQESNILAISRLRPVFGDMPIESVKPKHAYKYISFVTKKNGATSANRDFEVLSHSMTIAVKWGLVDRNWLKGQVTKNKIDSKTRYVEDWEIEQALTVVHPTIAAYIQLKQLVGLRCTDMLKLELTDALEEGLYADTGKTGAKLLITWTDELRAAVDLAISVRPVKDSNLFFCTRAGKSYATPNGKNSSFKSLWKRSMAKAIKDTELENKFSEKDIRTKTASDMDSVEEAQRLLGHTSPDTTRRHYRLKPEKVAPHSLKDKGD